MTTGRRPPLALTLLLTAVVAAGCAGSGDDGAAGERSTGDATTTTAAATPTTESPTPCGGDGPGIVRSACDGTAVVSFALDGEPGEISGGTCETTVAYLEVAAGTETGDEIDGARLDFADLLLPVEPGEFQGAEATIVWDGIEVGTARAEGEHDAAGGSFSAVLDDGRTLEGTFTC